MKVFISHSSHDKWVARQISAQLTKRGHNTFLDEKDIKTGDSVDSAIQQHLGNSDELLLVLSPQSITSHWVFIEMGGAKALGKKIIPILFHVAPNDIPTPISELLARDINDIEQYYEELEKRESGKPEPLKKKKKRAATKIVSVSEFRVGDKVKLVEVGHLTEEDRDRFPKWTKNMEKYSGALAIITRIKRKGIVYLSVDDGEYMWSTHWFTKTD